MPKTKREKILLAATAAVILAAVALTQLNKTGGMPGLAESGAQLQALRAQFSQYEAILDQQADIERGWDAIGQTGERNPNLLPEMQFTEAIHAMCAALQLPTPHTQPSRAEEIRDVKEYGLLYLTFNLEGPWAKIAQLLKQMDGRGYLIDKLEITSNTDQTYVRAEITAAQPVKLADLSAAPKT